MKNVGEWTLLKKLEIPFAVLLILLFNISYQKNISDNSIKTFITPPKEIKYFHFGQAMLMADLLWIRWIQNIEQCDAVQTKPLILGKVQQYPLQPCSNAWGTQMLDRITLLDPQFYSAYVLGATVTSVLVEDKGHLDEVFVRGVENFPKDWLIPYRAAYNALFVMNDKAKAADYLSIAGLNGAPTWVLSMASRLYTEEGAYELGIRSLEELLKQSEDQEYKDKIEQKLKALIAKKAAGP